MMFDTDIVIWALRGNLRAARWIDRERTRYLSAVSYMELLKGAIDKNDMRMIRRFLHDLRFEILPVTENISHRATIYMEEHVLSSGLEVADALIGATAAETCLGLCTGNDKHYRVLPDVELAVFRP